MKKTTMLILLVVMLLSLAACGGKDKSNGIGTATTSSEKATDQSNTDQQESTTKSNVEVSSETQPSFTEIIALDNEECAIKIVGIDENNIWGYSIKVFLENKSVDKSYTFSVHDAAINGVMCDPLFATDVAAGKKANQDISFLDDILQENGITDYSDIELTFRVYDSNDWMAEDVGLSTVHVYPYGEDKAARYVREAQPSDNMIIDNDYLSVIVTGYEVDPLWGYEANLYLINKSDKNIMLSAEEASINGFMLDPFFATTISAGKCAFSSISWSNRLLEENGIAKIEEIELVLRAYDSDDWFSEDFANETIILNP